MDQTIMKQVPITCSGHTRPIVHLEFSRCTPCGYFLISGSKDGKPMLRLGSTGDWIGTFQGHKGSVNGVAITEDACKAATASSDFTCKVWDAVSGDEVRNYAHGHIVRCVNFDGENKRMITAGNEKLIRLFDLERDDEESASLTLKGHEGSVKLIKFLPEQSDLLLTLSDADKSIRIWDVRQPASSLSTYQTRTSLNSFDVSSDGKYILTCEGTNICVGEFDHDSSIRHARKFEFASEMYSSSLDPSGKYIACGGSDYIMRRIKFDDGKEVDSYKGHFGPIHCVKFSPDGELYASGSEDGTLRLWQTNVGTDYGLWKVVNEQNQTSDN